ncbi:MAG: tetratricopeptide repeat protein [Verrucomicrobiota bacterium]|nr:tetratricopeptide repeat protein [Verrucomicrobiota bacterium]
MKLSLSKRLLFAGTAMLLALGVVEGFLALVGVRPESYLPDAYVGFEGYTPLFEEWTDEEGKLWMRTVPSRRMFFNDQRFSKVKPASGLRVFTLGGSTTYGRPYRDPTSFTGWMRSLVSKASPEAPVEIINAGGISYASYRVARLMEELLAYQPDVFVIYTGHNEFLEKRIYHKRPSLPTGLIRMAGAARHLRSATWVKRWIEPLTEAGREEEKARQLLKGEVDAVLDKGLGPNAYVRDPEGQQQILEHYTFNLHRMVQMARSVGAEVLFVQPASNRSACSPFKSAFDENLSAEKRQRWQAYYDGARKAFESRDPETTFAMLDAAEAVDATPASLHYVRGRTLEATGRVKEALQSYQRAIDEDVCPLRALSGIQQRLSEACQQLQVKLIDFDAMQCALSPSGVPGAEVFLDHVHPTIESHRQLALAIVRHMIDEQWLNLKLEASAVEDCRQEVLAGIDRKEHAMAMCNLAKLLGWAGKHAEAYQASREALGLHADLPAIQYQAGLAAYLVGSTEQAQEHYRQALVLAPEYGDAHCNLGVVLEEAGDLETARFHFQKALEHGSAEHKARDQENLQRVEASLKKLK